MNSDTTHTPWQQFKIQLRKTWSALTDEDLDAICQGHGDLVRVVQLRYDCPPGEAAEALTIDAREFLNDQSQLGLARFPRIAQRHMPAILKKSRRTHRSMLNLDPSENAASRTIRTRLAESPTMTESSP